MSLINSHLLLKQGWRLLELCIWQRYPSCRGSSEEFCKVMGTKQKTSDMTAGGSLPPETRTVSHSFYVSVHNIRVSFQNQIGLRWVLSYPLHSLTFFSYCIYFHCPQKLHNISVDLRKKIFWSHSVLMLCILFFSSLLGYPIPLAPGGGNTEHPERNDGSKCSPWTSLAVWEDAD